MSEQEALKKYKDMKLSDNNNWDISDDIPLEISIDSNKKKNAIDYAKQIMRCETCKYYDNKLQCLNDIELAKIKKHSCGYELHKESKILGCNQWQPKEQEKKHDCVNCLHFNLGTYICSKNSHKVNCKFFKEAKE